MGSPVALAGSFVASNPGMAYTYDWHVAASNGQVIADARGTAAVNAGVGTTSFQFTPTAAGAYTITLTITDGYGGVNQATLAETVGTITPFTTQIGTGASQIAGTSGTPTTLSATATGTYPVASYAWVVSAPARATPPAPGSGSSYTFTPTSAGNYAVTMTATDTAGDVSVSTVTVIVPFVAPSAQIVGVPANEYVPEGYAFSLAGVVDNPTPANDLTESWTVTAGDGSEAPYTVVGPERDLHARRHRVLHRHAQPARCQQPGRCFSLTADPLDRRRPDGDDLRRTVGRDDHRGHDPCVLGRGEQPEHRHVGQGVLLHLGRDARRLHLRRPDDPDDQPHQLQLHAGPGGDLRRVALGHGLSRVHQCGCHPDDCGRCRRPCR